MKPQADNHRSVIAFNKELVFSNQALRGLMQAVFQKGIPFRFKAGGFSMSPFIKDGDVLTVFPASGKSPTFGDVVALIHPVTQNIMVHRIVGKKSNSFMTKGDNADMVDPAGLPMANILGRVTRVERNGKRISLGLGPERMLIAGLSRSGLLQHHLLRVWRLLRPFAKRLEA